MNGNMHAVQSGDPHAPEGSGMVRVPQPGASYLVRTEGADSSRLELFTCEHGKKRSPVREQLITYLADLIRVNRQSIGPAVTGIWRWDDDDSRHEMHLSLVEVAREADGFDDEEWLLCNPADHDADIRFTVRIDTRGQQ